MADISNIKLPNNTTYNLSSYKLLSSDTRSDNQLPSWYMSNYPKCTVEEFKQCNKIGVNTLISDVYCNLFTIVTWTDNTGGRPIQIAVSPSGKRAQRVATSDSAWGNWILLPNSDTNTTYTFANGTNGFTVTPSGGTAQTVTVTPSITNNVTGSGTSGYLTKFNGAHTITNGPQLGSSTTTFLRNDGTWATPPGGTDTKNTAGSTNNTGKLFLVGALEQSANPQTYSNSNCYIDSSTFYTRGFRVRINNINVAEVGHNSNAGVLLVNDSTGGYSVWMRGDSGLICGKDIRALENVDGAFKNRVSNQVDTTDHFGKTTWYQGDNVPRVIIQGSNYYEETTPYQGENKNISLFNDYGEETIYMNSTTGKIYCNEIEFAVNSGTSRFVKSSGSWTFKECHWQRFGNVVTVNIQFKGGGSNVSVGSNAIVGTITDIPKPPFTVRLEGYYSGTVLMGELTNGGSFNVRILGQALNLSSANTATMSGTYVLDHTLES